MDLATKVNVALCILSFILATISVVTVVITLRQNNKMISESTRPYITILILRILKTGISLEAMPPWVSENGFSSFQAVC